MKRYMLTGLFALMTTHAHAARLDINPFLNNLQASYVYTQHGDHLAGGHYKAFEYPKEKPWASVNAGVLWDTEGDTKGAGGGFVSLSLKTDRVGNWALARSGLTRKVKTNFTIPKFDVGPFVGYMKRLGWLYGVHVAKGFGN